MVSKKCILFHFSVNIGHIWNFILQPSEDLTMESLNVQDPLQISIEDQINCGQRDKQAYSTNFIEVAIYSSDIHYNLFNTIQYT